MRKGNVVNYGEKEKLLIYEIAVYFWCCSILRPVRQVREFLTKNISRITSQNVQGPCTRVCKCILVVQIIPTYMARVQYGYHMLKAV